MPLLPPKKLKRLGVLLRSYLKRSPSGTEDISNSKESTFNTDLTTLKNKASLKEAVRSLVDANPDMSQSFNSLARLIITDNYTVIAKGVETGGLDVEATRYAQTMTARLDKLPQNYEGFNQQSTFSALSETLLKQLISNGDTGAELILGEGFVPEVIQPFSTNTLKYKQKGKRFFPAITVDSEEIDLDTPAVQIISLNQDCDTPYAESFYASAVAATFAAEEYRNDSRRAFKKASLPRVKATIDTAEFQESLPIETRMDAQKLQAAMDKVISDIKQELDGLQAEDAVVNFDIVTIDHMSQGNTSTHESLREHARIVNGNQASGLKTLPSILGRGESQTTASTETIIFLKLAENIQGRLNELFSGLLTLGARLAGYDVTVSFKYEKPSIRTESETESFTTMRQSRLLELLSLGFISDEHASLQLTGMLPPPGYTPLSGTRFRDGSDDPTTIENAYSNTSVSGKGVTETKVQQDTGASKEEPKTNKTTG